MGKIADLLAQKRIPLDAIADDILAAALNGQGQTFEARLKVSLQTLSRTEYSKLLELIDTKTDSMPNGDEVYKEVIDTLEFLGEYHFDDKTLSGRLVVIPLTLDAQANGWDLVISADQMGAMTGVFKELELIGEKARVTFLPRLLSLAEGQIIGYHQAFEILHHFVAGKPREALGVVTQTRLKEGLGFVNQTKPSKERRASCCLLVAYVETDATSNEHPFPFVEKLDLLNINSRPIENDEDDEESLQAMLDQSMSDMDELDEMDDFYAHLHDVLIAASAGTARALEIHGARIHDEPTGWFEGVSFLEKIERIVVANAWLERVAEQLGASDIQRLSFNPHLNLLDAKPGFCVEFFDKATLQTVDTLDWPALLFENPADCREALVSFLGSPDRALISSML